MKQILGVLVIAFSISYGQDTSRVDESATSENIALMGMTGLIIPMTLAAVVIGAVPPSGTIILKDGAAYGGINFETGFGIGTRRETGVFSDWRLGLSYSYIINSKVRDLYRIEAKRDFHFGFVGRRKIFLSGIHISGGFFSDFPNHGYTVGTGVWLKSPWLAFLGFIPQHTYGLTYRYNKYFTGKEFHEVSLGITSAFTF